VLRLLFVLSLFVASAVSAGCGAAARDAHPDVLVGKITHNGQPVKSVTVTVFGPDGSPAGGTTNDEGVYTLPSPPKGQLKFQLVAPGSGKPPFPVKYTQPNNDLTFEYTGGKQTYDMNLK
jgi:hypothetical protein